MGMQSAFTEGFVLRRAPHLVSGSAVRILKFLIVLLEQVALYFNFALNQGVCFSPVDCLRCAVGKVESKLILDTNTGIPEHFSIGIISCALQYHTSKPKRY